jgi:prepilin-type processing-associated H-X9-DG protein
MSTLVIVVIVAAVLVVVCGGLAVLVGLLVPAVTKVREAAGRTNDQNNLKRIGIGYHNAHDTTSTVPGYEFRDPKTGQTTTGLSGRVNLLPYVEQGTVYNQFTLTQPWDGPANRPLGNVAVDPFTSPLDPPGTATTRYRGFVGPGTMFEPGVRIGIGQIPDGTSNTITYITADDGVVWSKPDELPYDPNKPLPPFGQKAFPGGTNVLMADGSVRFLKANTPEQTVRRLITRNDGMVIPDW